MYLKGEDVEDALKNWVKEEIKEGTRQGYDIGKFFFTVSVGTIGALTAIEKLNENSQLDTIMYISFLFIFLSILISINMVRPGKISINGDTDIYDEYVKQVSSIINNGIIWFILWLIGTGVGIYGVRQ